MGNTESSSSSNCYCPSSFLSSEKNLVLRIQENKRKRHGHCQKQERPRRPQSAAVAVKRPLWGCETPQEHYDYIERACARIEHAHGTQGLALIGFQYQMWHNPYTCQCKNSSSSRRHPEQEDDDEYLQEVSVPAVANGHQFEEEEEASEMYLLPIDGGEDHDDQHPSQEYMIPVGQPILSREPSITDLRSFAANPSFESERSMGTMFSLATHHSYSTTYSDDDIDDLDTTPQEEHSCQMRLFFHPRNEKPILITETNHEDFIAPGKMYNEVARLCMEAAQEVMMQEGNLEWQDLGGPEMTGVGALVSKNIIGPKSKQQQQQMPTTLLIVTGKGLVRAGIFSRRHLMTTGMEASTALPFVRQARERKMDVLLLDPNAKQGPRMGMRLVEQSLHALFLDKNPTGGSKQRQDICILAHSMAGSQLVRFLHDVTPCDHENSHDDEDAILFQSGSAFLKQIKAIAFTDSNHNIQWTKDNTLLTSLIVGPSSLYIKSHRIHDEAKRLGQVHHHCDFWNHRFGTVKTLWAGTNEHALTNYVARDHIWDHYDACLLPT